MCNDRPKRFLAAFGKGFFGIATLLLLMSPTSSHPRSISPTVTHNTLNVIRNGDGSVKLALNNSPMSYNWSGYALANFATGQIYTTASASWVVPKVSFARTATSCQPVTGWGFSTKTSCYAQYIPYEYSSMWVGIGGSCLSARCAQVDRTLIQLGTAHHVDENGVASYYAWYETLPASETRLSTTNYPVAAGDSISASLVCLTNCTPGALQSWRLSMANATKKWTFTVVVPYVSSLLSADWIVEAPSSSGGILPLADFGKTTMNPSAAIPNSAFGGIGIHSITMVNDYGQTSVPSASTGLGTFSACWGSNMVNFAPCAAP